MARQPRRSLVNFSADPFAKDPPAANEFYAALGRANICWGRLEGMLADLTNVVAKFPGSDQLGLPKDGHAPVSFKRKLQVLRSAYKKLDELVKLDSVASKWLDAISTIVPDRVLFTHSLWHECVSENPLTFRIVSVKYKAGITKYEERNVSIGEVNDFSTKAHYLSMRLFPTYMNTMIAWSNVYAVQRERAASAAQGDNA